VVTSRDNEIAKEVRERLEEQGHRSVFLDFDPAVGTPPGRDWEQELYQQLRACQAVIVLCSEHSMASHWCFAEITHAKALGKHIFPIRVAECTINAVLTSKQVLDLVENAEEVWKRLARGLKAAGLDATGAFDWDGSRPPYPGLLAFQEEDAAIFFGRSAEIQQGLELLNRLRQFGGPRGVGVLGPSGSGKSSLVRAGLVPRLRRDTERWLVVDPFRPEGRPLQELAVVVAKAFGEHGDERNWKGLRDQWEAAAVNGHDQSDLLNRLACDLRVAADRPEARVLLVVDQAEELLGQDESDASHFFLEILRATFEAKDSPLMLLFTLRSDFLGRFQAHESAGALKFDDLRVGPMPVESLVQVIEGPAKLAGVELEVGLSQTLVNDTRTQDALPLLAFMLRELYERHGGKRRLEVKEYRDELGGLEGSVARAADAVFAAEQLPDKERAELRRALVSMARVNEDGQYVRRTVNWEKLPSSIHDVVERFVQARLLVSRGKGSERVLEVGHEALFRSWSLLQDWIRKDRMFLLWRNSLRTDVAQWTRQGKGFHRAQLPRYRTKEALQWYRRRRLDLNADEQAFLRVIRLREQYRRWTLRVAALLLGLVVLSVWNRLERARRIEADGLLATAILDTVAFGVLDSSAGELGFLGKLTSSSPSVRLAVLEQALSSTRLAQVRPVLRRLTHAVVGLNLRQRERVAETIVLPVVLDENADLELRIAALEVGAFLGMDWSDRSRLKAAMDVLTRGICTDIHGIYRGDVAGILDQILRALPGDRVGVASELVLEGALQCEEFFDRRELLTPYSNALTRIDEAVVEDRARRLLNRLANELGESEIETAVSVFGAHTQHIGREGKARLAQQAWRAIAEARESWRRFHLAACFETAVKKAVLVEVLDLRIATARILLQDLIETDDDWQASSLADAILIAEGAIHIPDALGDRGDFGDLVAESWKRRTRRSVVGLSSTRMESVFALSRKLKKGHGEPQMSFSALINRTLEPVDVDGARLAVREFGLACEGLSYLSAKPIVDLVLQKLLSSQSETQRELLLGCLAALPKSVANLRAQGLLEAIARSSDQGATVQLASALVASVASVEPLEILRVAGAELALKRALMEAKQTHAIRSLSIAYGIAIANEAAFTPEPAEKSNDNVRLAGSTDWSVALEGSYRDPLTRLSVLDQRHVIGLAVAAAETAYDPERLAAFARVLPELGRGFSGEPLPFPRSLGATLLQAMRKEPDPTTVLTFVDASLFLAASVFEAEADRFPKSAEVYKRVEFMMRSLTSRGEVSRCAQLLALVGTQAELEATASRLLHAVLENPPTLIFAGIHGGVQPKPALGVALGTLTSKLSLERAGVYCGKILDASESDRRHNPELDSALSTLFDAPLRSSMARALLLLLVDRGLPPSYWSFSQQRHLDTLLSRLEDEDRAGMLAEARDRLRRNPDPAGLTILVSIIAELYTPITGADPDEGRLVSLLEEQIHTAAINSKGLKLYAKLVAALDRDERPNHGTVPAALLRQYCGGSYSRQFDHQEFKAAYELLIAGSTERQIEDGATLVLQKVTEKGEGVAWSSVLDDLIEVFSVQVKHLSRNGALSVVRKISSQMKNVTKSAQLRSLLRCLEKLPPGAVVTETILELIELPQVGGDPKLVVELLDRLGPAVGYQQTSPVSCLPEPWAYLKWVGRPQAASTRR